VSAARDCLARGVLEEEIARVDSLLADLCKGRSHVAAVEHVKNRIARRRRPRSPICAAQASNRRTREARLTWASEDSGNWCW